MPLAPLLLLLFLVLVPATPGRAAVEVIVDGGPPLTLSEVYRRDGVLYFAVPDVLSLFDLGGAWDEIAHLYRAETPKGELILAPGSRSVRLGAKSTPLSQPVRFIDGRLRVPEEFVAVRLPKLLGRSASLRDLDGAVTDSTAATVGTTPASAASNPAAARLRAVLLDAAHGGEDAGALSPAGSKEKDVTLAVTQRLARLIKMRLDLPLTVTRSGDYTVTRDQRAAAMARPDLDAVLLLHAQASFGSEPRGIELFVWPDAAGQGTPALALARALAGALRQAGLTVGGIMSLPLAPLAGTPPPTVLVELGYLTNPGDRQLLTSADGQERLAQALLQGLQAYAPPMEEKHE